MRLLFLVVALCLSTPAVKYLAIPETTSVENVSVLQLIATPEKFDDHMVLVVGFVRLEREGDALYLHKEDYDQKITKNGLWLELSPSQRGSSTFQALNMHYVVLIGTFDSKNKGHRLLYSGSLTKIQQARVWPPQAD